MRKVRFNWLYALQRARLERDTLFAIAGYNSDDVNKVDRIILAGNDLPLRAWSLFGLKP
jgi:hypothetical protein